MITLHSWIEANRSELQGKPWLIVGKGPSADQLPVDLSGFNTFCLNDAVSLVLGRGFVPTVAHCIDLEVLDRVGDKFNLARWCMLPDRPHLKCKQIEGPLLTSTHFMIPCLSDRLVVYRKWAGEFAACPENWLPVRYFSVEAAFACICEIWNRPFDKGKFVYTVGIDGGAGYSSSFGHLKPLENGRQSFDVQFRRIGELEKKHCLKLMPLNYSEMTLEALQKIESKKETPCAS